MFEYALRTLPKFGIVAWLTYGSLLSAVRHAGFNPFDYDADLALLLNGPEDRKKLEAWLEQVNKDGFGLNQREPEFHSLWLANQHLDVYSYHMNDDGTIHSNEDDKDLPVDAIFPLAANCNFHGMIVPCPAKPLADLMPRYGEAVADLAVPKPGRDEHSEEEWRQILKDISDTQNCLQAHSFASLGTIPGQSRNATAALQGGRGGLHQQQQQQQQQ